VLEQANPQGEPAHALMERMPELVKGASMRRPGAIRPMDDDAQILDMSYKAGSAIMKATREGIARAQGGDIRKALNPNFAANYPMFLAPSPQQQSMVGFVQNLKQILSAELGKDITLTSPLSTGLVPYDLLAPARLIYPVFSPLRNKFPRTQGQGTSHRAKVIKAISGSRTGGTTGNSKRMSIQEFPGGQSFTNWPVQLPGSGSQSSDDMSIPYKFFGLSEQVSWLAQFAGQGFEDAAALANLILLQEAMIGEEDAMISGTGTALTVPATPTTAARTAGSNETALSGVTTNVFVKVSALNFYGETVASTGASQAWSAGQVIDVTIKPVPGALFYRIYTTTGTAAGTYFLFADNVGATKFTLQGALPTAGSNPATADTGTAATTDYEGIASVLTGWAATNSVYPSGYKGGYVNQSFGDTLNVASINTALQALWDGSGSFRADPAEIIGEGTDLANLAANIVTNGNTNYRIVMQPADMNGALMGSAVSEFVNPVTRSLVRMLVHPYLPQGNAMLMSYTMPMTFTNVPNIWENVMVQDYLTVSWPVIDVTFRYSIFWYGTLFCQAPQYNGWIGGIQKSAASPFS